MSAKQRLRRWVVWSSRPPWLQLYRGVYSAIIRVALARLRRHPVVRAVYLARGCARGAITPGVSDIDFVIFVGEGDAAPVHRLLARLARATGGLVDYYPQMVVDAATLARRWRSIAAWRYRYLEGQATWRLLHGEDVLAALPPLDEMRRRSASYAEQARWWLTFARDLASPSDDVLARNVSCYKVVAELLALSRGEGVDRARALAESDHPLARKLTGVAAARYLRDDPGLRDETLAFLVDHFTRLWAEFRERPFLEVLWEGRQRVEDATPPSAEERRAIERLRAPGTVAVARGAMWNFDELLLFIDTGGRVPRVAEIRRLIAASAPGISLFLRVGQVGFPLTVAWPRDLHRGLLTPWTAPDVFAQLDGDQRPLPFTEHARWFFAEWAPTLEWRRPAEKRAQLERIARSAARGEVVYPLSGGER